MKSFAAKPLGFYYNFAFIITFAVSFDLIHYFFSFRKWCICVLKKTRMFDQTPHKFEAFWRSYGIATISGIQHCDSLHLQMNHQSFRDPWWDWNPPETSVTFTILLYLFASIKSVILLINPCVWRCCPDFICSSMLLAWQ